MSSVAANGIVAFDLDAHAVCKQYRPEHHDATSRTHAHTHTLTILKRHFAILHSDQKKTHTIKSGFYAKA